jgi:hypothetical protein
MMGHDLEQRLKRMRRVPAPESLDRRMSALFDEAGHTAAGGDLEQQLKRIRRVTVPQDLDRRMGTLFDETEQDAVVRRPWRLPAWAAAVACLILVASLLLRGGLGPEPVVVEITPAGQLEQFLIGGEPSPASANLGIFTRGDCTVDTVWPADGPGWDRRLNVPELNNGE